MKSKNHLHIQGKVWTKEDITALSRAIFTATGIKLMAENKNDILDGYITTWKDELNIFLYEENENPNSEHLSTLKIKIPTALEITTIQNIINSF